MHCLKTTEEHETPRHHLDAYYMTKIVLIEGGDNLLILSMAMLSVRTAKIIPYQLSWMRTSRRWGFEEFCPILQEIESLTLRKASGLAAMRCIVRSKRVRLDLNQPVYPVCMSFGCQIAIPYIIIWKSINTDSSPDHLRILLILWSGVISSLSLSQF